jgi:hypothetical protein
MKAHHEVKLRLNKLGAPEVAEPHAVPVTTRVELCCYP